MLSVMDLHRRAGAFMLRFMGTLNLGGTFGKFLTMRIFVYKLLLSLLKALLTSFMHYP